LSAVPEQRRSDVDYSGPASQAANGDGRPALTATKAQELAKTRMALVVPDVSKVVTSAEEMSYARFQGLAAVAAERCVFFVHVQARPLLKEASTSFSVVVDALSGTVLEEQFPAPPAKGEACSVDRTAIGGDQTGPAGGEAVAGTVLTGNRAVDEALRLLGENSSVDVSQYQAAVHELPYSEAASAYQISTPNPEVAPNRCVVAVEVGPRQPATPRPRQVTRTMIFDEGTGHLLNDVTYPVERS